MIISFSDDEVREIITDHVNTKYKLGVSNVYLAVDEEAGTFTVAEVEINDEEGK